MVAMRRVAAFAITSVLVLSGCGVSTSTADTSIISEYESKNESESVDTTELFEVAEQYVDDFEKYGYTTEMADYKEAVDKALELAMEDDVTQSEIDKAVKRMKRKRKYVIDPLLSKEVETLPSYGELVADPERFVGHVYVISGQVTTVSGGGVGLKGEARKVDRFIHMFIDDGQSELVTVRVPYDRYSSVHKTFSGRCEFEGLDSDGRPLFVSYAYEADK